MSKLLKNLNESQKEAVQTTEGPILVIAGAGSGKTRTLTHRVAYLIQEKKVSPSNILAVTFTNKAATEMKDRIISLLNNSNDNENRYLKLNNARNFLKIKSVDQRINPLIGTFHSLCVKILRQEIDRLGYKKSFNIFDDQDQLALMKKIFKEEQLSSEQFNPQAILGTISKAKNELTNTEKFSSNAIGFYEETVAKLYIKYQKALQENNALDFDDLIMLTVKIFYDFPVVLEKYQQLFRYIMVDEYQDTNHAQYVLVKMLSQKHKNIWVCGDDWQGVYSWRGANIQNILNFEKDYPQSKVIKLEQNYRSTQIILDAGYGVISKNINRKDKKIWTENKGGNLITSYEADDERDEAEFIVKKIKNRLQSAHKNIEEKEQKTANYNDFAVLYRTNSQSRAIEEVFLKHSIPYRIIGGTKFYQRKEIKDIIAYLRLIQDENDLISLERIINEPPRGIGKITLQKWLALAKKFKTNPLDFISNKVSESHSDSKIENSLPEEKRKILFDFYEFILSMKKLKNTLNLPDFIEKVYYQSGYQKMLYSSEIEKETRAENIMELLSVAGKYQDGTAAEVLSLFLEEVALASDTDKIDQRQDAVHLMTLHSAKGLEFPIVFIVGLEEGILPYSRSILNASEMEEERRLMYVGITRAKEKVYLLFTKMRTLFGSIQVNPPSRFLADIPKHLVEISDKRQGINKSSQILRNTKQESNFEAKSIKDKNISKNAPPSANFKDGQKVKHSDFGNGIIISSAGDLLTVAFANKGIKKLSATYANLEIL